MSRVLIVRRPKLGRGSTRAIQNMSNNDVDVWRSDLRYREPESRYSAIFRWGCTSTLPDDFTGIPVYNHSKNIHLTSDKLEYRRVLAGENVGDLLTYFNTEDAIAGNHFPYVLRPPFHSQGRRLYVANDRSQLVRIWEQMGREGYISPLWQKTAEYRIFCVQGRAVCVARKYPSNPEAVAWNVAQGGRFENVRWDEWPLKATRIALQAFSLSGLHYGGVDVMLGSEGNIGVLEINSAPSLTSEYRQGCFAKAFDWMVEHGGDTIPLVDRKGNYKKFIHPAICDSALL